MNEVFRSLDHIAIAVRDTEAALLVWRDQFRFPVLFAEKVNGGTVLLTHLDLGNTHLQLAQPLIRPHVLWDFLDEHGNGLHHFCLAVDDVGMALEAAAGLGLPSGQPQPHQGPNGKRACFLNPGYTDGVVVELTGP